MISDGVSDDHIVHCVFVPARRRDRSGEESEGRRGRTANRDSQISLGVARHAAAHALGWGSKVEEKVHGCLVPCSMAACQL